MQVLDVAGGWRNVLSLFNSDHVVEMELNTNRFMVLLIDFDDEENRLEKAKADIPEHMADRVFILGASSDPETFKAKMGP